MATWLSWQRRRFALNRLDARKPVRSWLCHKLRTAGSIWKRLDIRGHLGYSVLAAVIMCRGGPAGVAGRRDRQGPLAFVAMVWGCLGALSRATVEGGDAIANLGLFLWLCPRGADI